MIHKRAEQPHGKKKSNPKTAAVQRSTVQSMRERADQLFSHGDHYNSFSQLKPFIELARDPRFSTDPERALIILHNCFVMRMNKGFDSRTAEIVKGINSILNDRKAKGESLTRLQDAANKVAGEEEIIVGADRKVGFSLKEPKAEKPMAVRKSEPDESDTHVDEGEPDEAELAKIEEHGDRHEEVSD
ncbi:Uncharacterised protein [uncultured archaeon]|nr:Uncharacterised protein [uncultured archaeon]